jgi:hypothetical protein
MTIINRQTPFGDSVFCDDIRFEQGGKFTLVGCYFGELIPLGPYPLMLPKLGVLVNFVQREEDGYQDVVFSIVYRESEGTENIVLFELQTTKEQQMPPGKLPEKNDEYDDPVILGSIPVVLSTVKISGPGKLLVLAKRGDKTYRIGTLKLSEPMRPAQNQPQSTDALLGQ